MKWHIELAKKLSKHSDSIAVIRAGKRAKNRTTRRMRRGWKNASVTRDRA